MFVLQFLAVVISNYTKHSEVKNIFKQENILLQLTFNPGLTLNGFRTTRPCMSGCGSVSGYHTLLFLLYELLDGVVLAVLIFHKALKRFFMKASTLIADGNSWMTLTHGITTFRRSGIRWCFLVWLAGVCYESLSRHGCNFHMLGSLGYRVELVVFTRAMIQVNHLSRAVRSVKSNSTRISDVKVNRVHCRDKYPSTMFQNPIEK